MTSRLPIAVRVAAIAVALLGVTACSNGVATPPRATLAPARVCIDAAEFGTAFDALESVDLATIGTDSRRPAVDRVSTAGAALQASAPAKLAPVVTALEAEIDGLNATLDQIGDGSIGSNLPAVEADIAGVSKSWSELQGKLAAECAR
jgi:hypothetical protein